MKKVLLFLFISIQACAQVITPPSGYTSHYGIRLYPKAAYASADSLNANSSLIDSVMYMNRLSSLRSTATGLSYDSSNAVFSLASGYVIPTTTEESNWNTAYGWGNHALAGYYAGTSSTIRGLLSSSATGLTYTNTTGDFSLSSGYVIPTTTEETNWNLAYTRSGLLVADSAKWNDAVQTVGYDSTKWNNTSTTVSNDSTNWNTAYTDRLKWDGGSSGLVALTGRTSLGLPSTTMGLIDSVQFKSNLALTYSPVAGSSSITTLGTITSGTIDTTYTNAVSKINQGYGIIATKNSKDYTLKVDSTALTSKGFVSSNYMNKYGLVTVDSLKSNLFTSGYIPYYNGYHLVNSPIYTDGGKVGIGTTTPNYKLDISTAPASGIAVNLGGDTGYGSVINYSRGGSYNWSAGIGGASSTNGIPTSCFGISQSNTTPRLVIDTNGNVGIGNTSPKGKLDVTGRIFLSDTLRVGNYSVYSWIKPGDATWTASSDSTLKTNIKDFSKGIDLSQFSNVVPKTFKFKKNYFKHHFDSPVLSDTLSQTQKDSIMADYNKKVDKDDSDAVRFASLSHTGFIAEDFNKKIMGTDSKEINYADIIAVLWLKVQELEARVAELEKK